MARQADPETIPGPLAAWMAPFAGCFTRPTWANLLVLAAGAILSPGRRTVASALSSVGLRGAATFTNYHRVLNRSRWSGQAVARCLLGLLVAAFVPSGPVVVGIDETIERRWGAGIKARGIYRDPVRSSRGHFVKTSGLRWISLMLLAPVPFAGRVWALPFLTALAPSERYAQEQGCRHKLLTDRARQLLLLPARWLPGREVVAVADSSLRRHRTACSPAPPPDRDHSAPARRAPVRPATAQAARDQRAPARLRRAPADAASAPGRPENDVAARHGHGLVWVPRAADRHRLGHGTLVSPRQASAGPVAARPRRGQ